MQCRDVRSVHAGSRVVRETTTPKHWYLAYNRGPCRTSDSDHGNTVLDLCKCECLDRFSTRMQGFQKGQRSTYLRAFARRELKESLRHSRCRRLADKPMVPIDVQRCCIRENPVHQVRTNEGAEHFMQRLRKLLLAETKAISTSLLEAAGTLLTRIFVVGSIGATTNGSQKELLRPVMQHLPPSLLVILVTTPLLSI